MAWNREETLVAIARLEEWQFRELDDDQYDQVVDTLTAAYTHLGILDRRDLLQVLNDGFTLISLTNPPR